MRMRMLIGGYHLVIGADITTRLWKSSSYKSLKLLPERVVYS